MMMIWAIAFLRRPTFIERHKLLFPYSPERRRPSPVTRKMNSKLVENSRDTQWNTRIGAARMSSVFWTLLIILIEDYN